MEWKNSGGLGCSDGGLGSSAISGVLDPESCLFRYSNRRSIWRKLINLWKAEKKARGDE